MVTHYDDPEYSPGPEYYWYSGSEEYDGEDAGWRLKPAMRHPNAPRCWTKRGDTWYADASALQAYPKPFRYISPANGERLTRQHMRRTIRWRGGVKGWEFYSGGERLIVVND